MIRLATTDRFDVLDRAFDPPSNAKSHTYNRHHYLQLMNDASKRGKYQAFKLQTQAEPTTVMRMYERQDWQDFIGPTFLDPILENTSYMSVSQNLATSVTSIGQGTKFLYREFDNFQRAQRGAENTEFERRKGKTTTQEVTLHTLGARSYVTEEEMLDLPIDSMQMELRTMGAALSLEQDLLWTNSLYRATSAKNATTFGNVISVQGTFNVEVLHLCLQYFQSPFTSNVITPYSDKPKDTEALMRIGKFRATDVLVSPATYWDIVNTDYLKAQHIWSNSRILDTGELSVPLLGVNIHKVNMGYFVDENDPDSWVATNDIYLCDRRQGGCGTIGVRQPLQVRNFDMPNFRTQDFMVFERLGFAVQNRRSLLRVEVDVDPYTAG